jgi:ATP-binding cassette subfamily C protein
LKTFKSSEHFFLDSSFIKKYLYIKEGSCNIYLVRKSDGKPYGKRHFLFTAHSENIIFPVENTENFMLLAVIAEDMKADDEYIPDDNSSFELKRKEIFRIMAESLQQSKAEIDRAEKKLDEKSFIEFISGYTASAEKIYQKSYEDIIRRNKLSYRKQKKSYYNSFDILSDSLKNKNEKKLSISNTDNIDDNLFKACKVTAEYLKIKIKVPFYLEKGYDVENPLEEIAFASHFRIRQVILERGWHRNATVPYIAYLKDTDNPVALIPAFTGYNIYDPVKNTISKVSKKKADKIDTQRCYIIYRGLPSENVTTKSLFKFCLSGIHKADLLGMIVLGIAGGLLSAVSPLIISWIFDSVISEANQTLLKELAGILISITCVQFIFELVRSYAVMRMENFFEMDIQSSLWDRILSLPTTFFKRYSPGELAEKIDGVSQIREIISGRVINQILSSVFGVFYIVVMFSISADLALISLAVIILITIVSVFLSLGEIKYYKQSVNASAELSGKMISWLNGITKIRTSNAESRIYNIWAEKFTHIRELDINRTKIHNASQIFCSVASVLVSMCMYFYIIKNNNNFQLESGMFVAFNTALMVVLSNFISLTETITELNSILPLYNNIKPAFETEPEYDDTNENIGEINGNIEISHVSFRYSKDTPLILKDISFNIKQGEHIALVGTSGSGKSTMLRVILGFEKPESGQIYFDGKDISQFDIRSIRKQLGVVLQSGQLLPGSIFDNVVGSNNSLNVEDVERALKMAGFLDEVNEMPMGIHTMVSEDFKSISGGQKQRILIARALVSNPKILFFDEATSALDNKTQKIVSDSINKLNITRITIAHRLSTITECDRIIVLDKGKIAEEGTYDELVKNKGIFFDMVQRQIV